MLDAIMFGAVGGTLVFIVLFHVDKRFDRIDRIQNMMCTMIMGRDLR